MEPLARAAFAHTDRFAYLNHASTAPLSRPVVGAMEAYLAERSATHIDNYLAFQPVVDETLGRLARVLGTTPDRVEFAPNTTSALSIVAEGLAWQAGDRVALPACEFPANVYPFLQLERLGVTVDWVPHRQGVVPLEAFERVLTPRTRLLTVSWVQFLSGYRVDLPALSRLCRANGTLLCVDAIQGLGALRLDVEAAGVDFLACGAQKWMMGPQGVAFLYLTEALQAQITPRGGWLSGPVDWERFFDYSLRFYPDARRFRLGTLNNVGIAGLHAALGLYLEVGPEAAEQAVLARAEELQSGLARLGLARYGTDDPAAASGIVTVEHPDPEGLLEALRREGVVAAVRNRCVRFSPTYYNTTDETARALDVVGRYGKVRLPSS